jgi:tetratricopeptide (TPR) repeat protein
LNYGIHGWQFLSGENTHPELPTLYSNLAGMLMKLNQNELAISYLHKACQINEDMFGLLSPQNVATKETLTRAYFAAEDFRNALAAQQIVYKFHKEQFGAEDEKTKNVALILKSLTAKAVEVAKKQKAISSKKSKGKK